MRRILVLGGLLVGFAIAAACHSFEGEDVPVVDAGFDVPSLEEAGPALESAAACPEVVAEPKQPRRLHASPTGVAWIEEVAGADGGPITGVSSFVEERGKKPKPQFMLAEGALDLCVAGPTVYTLREPSAALAPLRVCPLGAASCPELQIPIPGGDGGVRPVFGCDGPLVAFSAPPSLVGYSTNPPQAIVVPKIGDAVFVAPAGGALYFARSAGGVYSATFGFDAGATDGGFAQIVGEDAGARAVGGLAARASRVYFVGQDGGVQVLVRTEASGQNPTILRRGALGAFDVDDAAVFLVVANNGVVRLNRDAASDKANDERLLVPEQGVTSLGLTADYVYYTTPTAVKRVPKTGCP